MRRFFRVQDRLRRDALDERERALARRKKYPGPTFVSDGDRVLFFQLEGVPGEAQVRLEAGVPYVARDNAEAKLLQLSAQRGDVRLIDRFEARRLRAARARGRT